MRKWILSLLCAGLFSGIYADGPLGLGLVVGDPTGLSGKYWLNSRDALDGIVGVGVGHHGHFSMSVDWTRHWSNLTPVRSGHFQLGLGVGGLLGVGDDPYAGVRFKGLADYLFAEAPVNVFIEMAPTVVIVDPILTVTGGLGVRWFFQ